MTVQRFICFFSVLWKTLSKKSGLSYLCFEESLVKVGRVVLLLLLRRVPCQSIRDVLPSAAFGRVPWQGRAGCLTSAS